MLDCAVVVRRDSGTIFIGVGMVVVADSLSLMLQTRHCCRAFQIHSD